MHTSEGEGCEAGVYCLLPLCEPTNGNCVILTGYIASENTKHDHERPQQQQQQQYPPTFAVSFMDSLTPS